MSALPNNDHSNRDDGGQPNVNSVSEVIVVSKTHMDVGFTNLAAEVRDRYLFEFFPAALATAKTTAQAEDDCTFVWTVGSWIMNEALNDPTIGPQVEQGIVNGVLRWHAMPFTVHSEYCDRSVLASGLRISKRLDEKFGVTTRAAKMTDVPGHTRGLVSLLHDAGVKFLHIGLNPVAAAPEVPLQFLWQGSPVELDKPAGNSSATSIAVMFEPGSYGDVQIIKGGAANGGDLAVAAILTGDNLGPPTAAMIRDTWADISRQFPHARIRAGSLEDIVEPMLQRTDLPVVTQEIGDTWIHGVGADPQKTAAYRALCRLRRNWIATKRIDETDPRLERATAHLLMVGEHTWGMDQKTWWPNQTAWTAEALNDERNKPSIGEDASSGDIALFESSWEEQRQYLTAFVETLQNEGLTSLAVEAREVLVEHSLVLTPERTHNPDRVAREVANTGNTPRKADTSSILHHAGWQLVVDGTEGTFRSLLTPQGIELCNDDGELLSFTTQLFDADHFESWHDSYNEHRRIEDQWWARWDNTKPGLESTNAKAAWVAPQFVNSAVVDTPSGPMLQLSYDYSHLDQEWLSHGSFASLVCLELMPRTECLDVQLTLFNRIGCRFPQADWWRINPALAPQIGVTGNNIASGWEMLKLGEWIEPESIVAGGSRFLHVVDQLRHSSGMEIEFFDTPLVAVGRPRILTWGSPDTNPHSPVGQMLNNEGWTVCLYNNLWGTNFPVWNSGTIRSRIRMTPPCVEQ